MKEGKNKKENLEEIEIEVPIVGERKKEKKENKKEIKKQKKEKKKKSKARKIIKWILLILLIAFKLKDAVPSANGAETIFFACSSLTPYSEIISFTSVSSF